MKAFKPLLKNINEKINLPQPTRSRIILEIAADLEDTYQFYLNKGYSENEAQQKAEEKFSLTDETLSELVKVHQSVFRKFLDRLNEQAQSRWERMILFLVLLLVISIGAKAVLSAQFFLQASHFVWPIWATFLSIVSIALFKVYQFNFKKDFQLKTLRSGLSAILVLSSLNIYLGIFGYILELYSNSGTSSYSGLFDVVVTVMKSSNVVFFTAIERIQRCASMAMVCAFVTILSALIWFWLNYKIQRIEQAEAAILLDD